MLLKIKSFLLAVWSFARWGDVAISEYVEREAICRDCPYFERTKHGLFCGACGCPKSPISDLRTKWRMPLLGCPEHRW